MKARVLMRLRVARLNNVWRWGLILRIFHLATPSNGLLILHLLMRRDCGCSPLMQSKSWKKLPKMRLVHRFICGCWLAQQGRIGLCHASLGAHLRRPWDCFSAQLNWDCSLLAYRFMLDHRRDMQRCGSKPWTKWPLFGAMPKMPDLASTLSILGVGFLLLMIMT